MLSRSISKLLLGLVALCAMSPQSFADIIQFDLFGKAGAGLLSGNENVAVINGTPGTGGEVGAGITYDNVSKILSVNVRWGSAQGFTGSLTGNATAMHIHGPTAAGGAASFTQNAPVLFGIDNLAGFNSTANGGGFGGQVAVLTAAQELELLAGRYYLNVHTAANGGGELRGNLVAVPEPSSLLLAGLAIGGVGLIGYRRKKKV